MNSIINRKLHECCGVSFSTAGRKNSFGAELRNELGAALPESTGLSSHRFNWVEIAHFLAETELSRVICKCDSNQSATVLSVSRRLLRRKRQSTWRTSSRRVELTSSGFVFLHEQFPPSLNSVNLLQADSLTSPWKLSVTMGQCG